MIVVAIDNSITSPGIMRCELDENLNIVEVKFLTFSSTKKFQSKTNMGEVITYSNSDYKGKQFNKIMDIHNHVISFIGDNYCDYMVCEDYAYSGKGDITGLAESMGLLKSHFYNMGSKIRLYSIPSIKKFYTGKGTADKVLVEEYFDLDDNPFKPDLSFLPKVYESNTAPTDNLVDSWAILTMLLAELKLRQGVIQFKDLTDKQREVFLQADNKQPNYPARDFIKK